MLSNCMSFPDASFQGWFRPVSQSRAENQADWISQALLNHQPCVAQVMIQKLGECLLCFVQLLWEGHLGDTPKARCFPGHRLSKSSLCLTVWIILVFKVLPAYNFSKLFGGMTPYSLSIRHCFEKRAPWCVTHGRRHQERWDSLALGARLPSLEESDPCRNRHVSLSQSLRCTEVTYLQERWKVLQKLLNSLWKYHPSLFSATGTFAPVLCSPK